MVRAIGRGGNCSERPSSTVPLPSAAGADPSLDPPSKYASSRTIRGGPGVRELIDGLHALDVSCNGERPRSRDLETRYAKYLEVLALYTEFHAQERGKEGSKRLLWVCDVYSACGGLADRVKGVAYALTLAILSRRVLLLDWRDSQFGEQAFLQPNLIDWRLTQEERIAAYPENGAYDTVYYYNDHAGSPDNSSRDQNKPSPYNGPVLLHLFSILGGLGVDVSSKTLESSLEALDDSWEWVLLASNMEPSSLTNGTKTASQQWIRKGMAVLGLSSLSDREIDGGLIGLVFRYLFKFSDGLRREVELARGALGLSGGGEAYVGVHVRTGFLGWEQQESVRHPKLYRSPQQWEKTLTCSLHFANSRLGHKSLIFLATDSNLVKNGTLDVRKYEGRIRSLDNSVVHLDRLEKAPHEADSFETEGVMSVWVELILLAEAHGLVMGDSGFSFLAQSLCFTPDTRVVNGLTCSPFQPSS